MPRKKIAVLGSAFNPPTLGHWDVIQQCLSQFDEIWLVPSFKHAFGKDMLLYSLRVEMVKAFVKDIGDAKVIVKAVEDKIPHDKAVYSIDLVRYLKKHTADSDHISFHLIIGPDNAHVFDTFKDAAKLKKEFPPHVVAERVDIRSTKVRHAITHDEPYAQWLSPRVAKFIATHELYQPIDEDNGYQP